MEEQAEHGNDRPEGQTVSNVRMHEAPLDMAVTTVLLGLSTLVLGVLNAMIVINILEPGVA